MNDSVPGFDNDSIGLQDLVSRPFPQSSLKGYACDATASCIHDCLKYAFPRRTAHLNYFIGGAVVFGEVSMIVLTKDPELAS